MKAKTTVVIVAGLILLLLAVGLVISGEVAREPLDQLWEEHMLTGTPAIHANGKRMDFTPEEPFEAAKGWPFGAAFTKQGITVSDHREARRLGLWVGGGWALVGGLLGKVEEQGSSVELYGKGVTRTEPSFILDFRAFHAPKERLHAYEFFLLYRKRGTAQATILRKWIFRPEDVRWFGGEVLGDVRSYLQYDAGTKTATVTITGLIRPFEERVDLTGVLHE